MKKAERIYRSTFAMIKSFVEDENIEHKEFTMSFNYDEDETICTRTVNEIEKINEREFKIYEFNVAKGFKKEDAVRRQTFINVRNTINQWRKNEEEWNELIDSFN